MSNFGLAMSALAIGLLSNGGNAWRAGLERGETAEGAFQAMKAAGKEKQALIVSVDGGCPGVQNVKAGVIGATSMQFPLLMASKGVEAVAAFAKDGSKPKNSEGLTFFNTGVQLITDKPVDGLPSITSEEGLKICWG